jgi:hypothetical protein
MNVQSKAGGYRIWTNKGQHCGLLYLTEMTAKLPEGQRQMDFVMISSLFDTPKRRHGSDTINGPIPVFDESVFT